MYKGFSEIPVWQNSLQVSIEVFKLSVNLPCSENYSLRTQIRGIASSVSANILEAFGRKKNKVKSNFHLVARGFSYQTQNHLIYSTGVGYFNNNDIINLLEKYYILVYEINNIIHTLSKTQTSVLTSN